MTTCLPGSLQAFWTWAVDRGSTCTAWQCWDTAAMGSILARQPSIMPGITTLTTRGASSSWATFARLRSVVLTTWR